MNWRDLVTLAALLTVALMGSLTPQAGTTNFDEISRGLADVRGLGSWYCGHGSPCTRGYGPSDLVAAIDPTTGYEKGERVTVWHGDRSVSVRIVDVCACDGARVIDLTSGAFSRLAPLSAGVIRVVLVPDRVSPTLPPTDTLPESGS